MESREEGATNYWNRDQAGCGDGEKGSCCWRGSCHPGYEYICVTGMVSESLLSCLGNSHGPSCWAVAEQAGAGEGPDSFLSPCFWVDS